MRTKRQQLTEEQRKEAITRYTKLDRMEDIAKDFGCTRQGIYKILKKAGVSTGKEQRIEVRCTACGKAIRRHRCRARQTKNSFCSQECYLSWLETLGEDYNPSSYYARMGQQIVKQYFDYQPENGHILHHINKDCSDNRRINLMVFANQGDHVRYHRGFQATPIWDGRIH